MSLLQTVFLNPTLPHSFKLLLNPNPNFLFPFSSSLNPNPNPKLSSRPLHRFSVSAASNPNQNSNSNPSPKSHRRTRRKSDSPKEPTENSDDTFPSIIPRKPRRGRRSEVVAVEDFVRESLERTFASIREQNSGVLDEKDKILKKQVDEEEEEEEEEGDSESQSESKNESDDQGKKREEVVEEDDPNWPLDADVGWGIRASEYFEQYPIKNLVEEGVEIDWEGELDDSWVKEINCLEWESFAFHPSPLIVLAFERYKRAVDNWKLLKELEKAVQIYWNAKDRLPPRTVKFDVNIEKDMAYALKVKECPELLFLRGNTILYREKEHRTRDELVQMIAHFYYNAKRPSWIDASAVSPGFYR